MSNSDDTPFRFRFRVRYAECDAQSVVFNARYGDYVDISVNEYIRTLFGDYQNLLDQDMDIQVVNLTMNYRAPARFDDVLEARISAGKIGRSSFTLHLDFHRCNAGNDGLGNDSSGKDGAGNGKDRRVADADIVYVLIQPSLMQKQVIPDHIRQLLEVGAPGVLISHAGE